MLRFLFGLSLVVLVACYGTDVEKFDGSWTGVKIYPEVMGGSCDTVTFKKSPDFCKCGEDAKIPVVEFLTSKGIEKFPIMTADLDEDVDTAAKLKCTCQGNNNKFLIFRYLTENYMALYEGKVGTLMFGLLAKDVPSQKDLEVFEKSNDLLKDKTGSVICVKEMLQSSNNVVTSTATGTSNKLWAAFDKQN